MAVTFIVGAGWRRAGARPFPSRSSTPCSVTARAATCVLRSLRPELSPLARLLLCRIISTCPGENTAWSRHAPATRSATRRGLVILEIIVGIALPPAWSAPSSPHHSLRQPDPGCRRHVPFANGISIALPRSWGCSSPSPPCGLSYTAAKSKRSPAHEAICDEFLVSITARKATAPTAAWRASAAAAAAARPPCLKLH